AASCSLLAPAAGRLVPECLVASLQPQLRSVAARLSSLLPFVQTFLPIPERQHNYYMCITLPDNRRGMWCCFYVADQQCHARCSVYAAASLAASRILLSSRVRKPVKIHILFPSPLH